MLGSGGLSLRKFVPGNHKAPVTANSDPTVTMSERIRQYALEYPNMKAKAICHALCIDYEKHGSLARKVLFQEHRRYPSEAGVWGVTRCLNPSLHHVVFESSDCAPQWLVELVVSQGSVFGWRMVKAGNLVYYLREIQHFAQIRLFPKSRKLLLYGRGEQSLKEVLTSLFRYMAGEVLDGWKEGELQLFIERLFAFGASQHVAVQIPGVKMVGRFKARLPDTGVVVQKDNSHPNCLEFEFNVPTPVRDLAAHIEKQSAVLTDFTQQIKVHLSVLQSINKAVNRFTEAINDFKNVVKSSSRERDAAKRGDC